LPKFASIDVINLSALNLKKYSYQGFIAMAKSSEAFNSGSVGISMW
jgi:hypothetical protein